MQMFSEKLENNIILINNESFSLNVIHFLILNSFPYIRYKKLSLILCITVFIQKCINALQFILLDLMSNSLIL